MDDNERKEAFKKKLKKKFWRCDNCLFSYYQSEMIRLYCRRYPESALVSNDYWCGEFIPDKIKIEGDEK